MGQVHAEVYIALQPTYTSCALMFRSLALLCFAGVGAGGQLGATGGTLLTQHVLKQQGGLANAEVDARAAFLRHAQKTDDNISRFTAAYKCVQCDCA